MSILFGQDRVRQPGDRRLFEKTAQGKSVLSAVRTRATTCVASSDWPPSSKKLS